MRCDVCEGKIVSSEREGWYECSECGMEYPLKWMQARFQKAKGNKPNLPHAGNVAPPPQHKITPPPSPPPMSEPPKHEPKPEPQKPEPKPEPPKHESKPEPPKHEPKPEPPKHEPKPEPPKHESKPEPPKHESKPEPPKHEQKLQAKPEPQKHEQKLQAKPEPPKQEQRLEPPKPKPEHPKQEQRLEPPKPKPEHPKQEQKPEPPKQEQKPEPKPQPITEAEAKEFIDDVKKGKGDKWLKNNAFESKFTESDLPDLKDLWKEATENAELFNKLSSNILSQDESNGTKNYSSCCTTALTRMWDAPLVLGKASRLIGNLLELKLSDTDVKVFPLNKVMSQTDIRNIFIEFEYLRKNKLCPLCETPLTTRSSLVRSYCPACDEKYNWD